MDIWYIIFLAVGRLTTFIARKFISNFTKNVNWLDKVLNCVLCSGAWIYLILSFFTGYIIFEDWVVVPILSNVVTGIVSAYIWYLLENGYKSTQPIVIE